MRKIIAALGLVGIGIIAGCGGSGSTAQTTSVSGVVADGYLQNAQVFLDKNGNYQMDPGEPNTTTDQNGGYTLNVAAGDIGKYPIVAVAIKDQTIDMDSGLTLQNTYVLCTPAAGVTGTISNFISPISTLLREKLEANPGMTVAEAMTQLRNQLNIPAGIDVLGDYVAGAKTGNYRTQYQGMHQVAQQMATLMADQAGLVMNGRNPNKGRYRGMMGQINQFLPQIADNASQGNGVDSALMNSIREQMRVLIEGMPINAGFSNYSTLFRNMTSHSYFWNYSGGRMHPMQGMRGRR